MANNVTTSVVYGGANGYYNGYWYRYSDAYTQNNIKTIGLSSRLWSTGQDGGIHHFMVVSGGVYKVSEGGGVDTYRLNASGDEQAELKSIIEYQKNSGQDGWKGRVHKDAIDAMIESNHRYASRANIFTELFGVNPQ